MNILIALALFVSQDEEALRRDAKAFVKTGTDTAKAALLRAGAPAIRILLEERDDASFERVSDLLMTLRFADARGPAVDCRDHLALHRLAAGGGRWNLASILSRAAGYYLRNGKEYKGWLVYVDPSVVPDAEQLFVELPEKREMGKIYLELDRVLGPLKLDYAFRYGLILISTPARLWPSPSRRQSLVAEELAALKRLVDDLDAEDPELRLKAAKGIPSYGADAIPLLKRVASSQEAKTLAADLLRLLEARYGEPVWTTALALDGQTLDDEDRAVALALNGSKAALPDTAWFDGARLDAVLSTMARSAELPIAAPDLLADLKVTLTMAGLQPRDALTLLARTHGLDVRIQGRRIVVSKESK